MLLHSGIVFPSSFVTQASSTQHQSNRLHSGSFFVLVSSETQNIPLQPIILFLVCMHYPLCQFSGFLTRQCSSSHIHFHCYNLPSHHLLLVSENKHSSVITVFVGLYRHSKSPTHSHSSFILCGVLINYYYFYL